MDWEQFENHIHESKTNKGFFRSLLWYPFATGFLFGVGHFIAFALINVGYFKRLKHLAKIKG